MITKENLPMILESLSSKEKREIENALFVQEYIILKVSFFNVGAVVKYELTNNYPISIDDTSEAVLYVEEVVKELENLI